MPRRHHWWKTCSEMANLEAAVTGPGWAILFYGRRSLGEGLSLVEACDATFTPSGAISWIGKQAQLNTNAVSLWEGWQMIVQAITKWWSETRDLAVPILTYLQSCHSVFIIMMGLYRKRGHAALVNAWRSLGILIGCHNMAKAGPHNTARITVRGSETHGLHWPHHLHLHWITGLRVTEVQCQLPHKCHQGMIDLWAPGICNMAGATGSQEAIWKSICQSSRMRRQKETITCQSWHWDWMMYTLLPYDICSLQDYPDDLVRSFGTHHLIALTHIMWICCNFDIVNLLQCCTGFAPMLFQWSHSHMQHFLSWIPDKNRVIKKGSRAKKSHDKKIALCVSRHLDDILTVLDKHYNNVKALDALIQELFQLWMGKKETVSELGCICCGTSKFSWLCSQNASHRSHTWIEAGLLLQGDA